MINSLMSLLYFTRIFLTLSQKLLNIESMFKVLDKVKVMRGRNVVKEGIIVSITSSGARVYDDELDEYPFTDTIAFAEWFPFESPEQCIKMIRPYVPPKKV